MLPTASGTDTGAWLFAIAARALALGARDEQATDLVRVVATAVATISRAYREFIDETLIEPEVAAGRSIGDTLSRTSPKRREYRLLGADLVMTLLARYTDASIFQNLVVMGERALAEAGIVPTPSLHEPCIGFVDMTDYTGVADTDGDAKAATVARQFGRLVNESIVGRDGELVKLLGDGAMVAFPQSSGSVDWAVALLDRFDHEGLPQLHVGLHAGPVVRRDGDYFGGVVNIAARLAAQAGPGEILVTDRVRDAIAEAPRHHFDDLGDTPLRHVADPVHIYRVRPGA